MVRNYVKKTTRQKWSKESMLRAVKDVKSGKMSCWAAARSYEIPRSTLQRFIKKSMDKPDVPLQEKLMNTSNVDPAPSTSSSFTRREVNNPQISFSHEDIIVLGKHWAREFCKLQPDQRLYAKIAIEDVLSVAKRNKLHLDSITINEDFSIKTVTRSYKRKKSDPSSKSSPAGSTINDSDKSNPPLTESTDDEVNVKAEDIKIYDCSVASVNIKTEELQLYDDNNYIDSVSVKTEHRELPEDNSDNNEHLDLQYVDFGAGSIKSEEIYEYNNDNSNIGNVMDVNFDKTVKMELFDST